MSSLEDSIHPPMKQTYQMNSDKKPELLVLAAGIGSRYGSIKQLDAIGPNGETIMEYSIFDAIAAGSDGGVRVRIR